MTKNIDKKNKNFSSRQDAAQYYQKEMEAYLELRLLSRQNAEMKNYASKKKTFRKNIARALTFLNREIGGSL